MFERSEILLKKIKELLFRVKEISGMLPRLSANEEWWSRVLSVNERVHMLCESMNW